MRTSDRSVSRPCSARVSQTLEPPWYGPVCPVVGEGRRREAPPYPDHWRSRDGRLTSDTPYSAFPRRACDLVREDTRYPNARSGCIDGRLDVAGSLHAPIWPKPAITLSRKDWHSSANGAVL